jgi:hypothetical protein
MKLNLLLLSAAAMVSAATAIDTVELGTAGTYTILAKTGISTIPASYITGNIAVYPIAAAAITGFELTLESVNGGIFSTDSSSQVVGTVFAADYASPTPADLIAAVGYMETAYTDAAGRPNTDAAMINPGGGEIGGSTLYAGVYNFNTNIKITSEVAFNGGPDDVFILQTSGSIVQAANTKVILSGGALAKNIFWQVAGQVTVHAGAHMEGVLLVKTAVTFNTGSSLNGRILAQTAVTLQSATIIEE